MIDTLDPDAVVELEAEHEAMWSRCARVYVRSVGGLTGEAAEQLLDAAEVGDGTGLLDVGTGPGTVVGPALARGAIVSAIDLAPAMIDELRTRHPDVDATVANATSLPFDDASFDAVTMAFCLHHMAEPAAALTEAWRVLRPGGGSRSPSGRRWTNSWRSGSATPPSTHSPSSCEQPAAQHWTTPIRATTRISSPAAASPT